MSDNPLTRLRIFIANSYSLEDFRLLCTDLTILYDDLGGDERISVKANRLLLLIGRQRRYEDLLLVLRRTRPMAFEQGGFNDLTPEDLRAALTVDLGESEPTPLGTSEATPITETTNESIPASNANDVWVHPKTGKEMVRIPAGPFLFGKGLLFVKGKDELHLPEFWIDKTLVTNGEYARFVAETGYKSPKHWNTGGLFGFGKQEQKEPPAKLTYHPVMNVSWNDANAYAEWAGGSLPNEEQWEKAARGTDGREYPWGNDWQDGRCNTKEAGIGTTTPINQFSPRGDSPYGCVDMSGNVWEWTSVRTKFGYYLLKGGSYDNNKNRARAADRQLIDLLINWGGPSGFRLVMAAVVGD